MPLGRTPGLRRFRLPRRSLATRGAYAERSANAGQTRRTCREDTLARMRTCVRPMIVCVLFPRFALVAALGDRHALLAAPAALAPEPGRPQLVGEVSAAAETFGVSPGMRVGEALAPFPELRLPAPDSHG